MGNFFGRAGIWWGVLGLELILVLSPLMVTDYPPISDLPNHMARIAIIADAGHDPTLARMYRPAWHAIPDLAADLIGPPLLNLFPLSVVARILLGLAVTLCLAGTIAFHRARFEVRSYWPLAVGLVLYNAEFLLGFVNFVLGTGVALLAGAMIESRRPGLQRFRVLLSCIAALVIFFCHAWALLFFMLLLAAHEADDFKARAKRLRVSDVGPSILRLILPVIIPVILLLGFTPRSTVGGPIGWSSLSKRAIMAVSPFINYIPPFDLVSFLLVMGTIAILAFRGALWAPRSTILTLIALGLLFLACPWSVSGAFFLNSRLALFMALMLFAGLCPREPEGSRWLLPAGGLLASLLVARIAVVDEIWHSSNHDMQEFRALGATLPEGSRILAAEVKIDEVRSHLHDQPASRQLRGMLSNVMYLPSLWVIERRVFFPLLFSNPALQPLEVGAEYRTLSVPFGVPPDYRALFDTDLATQEAKTSRYLTQWQRNFDFLVVLNAGRAEHLDGLERLPLLLIGKTDIAALYRIER